MTAAVPPPGLDRARAVIRRGTVLSTIALLGIAGVYVLAAAFTPIEARQGVAQKIFYLHVPAAWSALLAFSLVGIVSVLYLWLEDPRLDRFAASSAEVGVVFGPFLSMFWPLTVST